LQKAQAKATYFAQVLAAVQVEAQNRANALLQA